MPRIQDWIRMYSSTNRDVRLRAANGLLARSKDIPLDLLIDILLDCSHEGLGSKTEKGLLNRSDPGIGSANDSALGLSRRLCSSGRMHRSRSGL